MEIAGVNLFIAFVAGVVSILSPCVLPLIPIYLAYLTGSTAEGAESGAGRGSALFHAVAFTGGFSLVLIGLGVSVGAIGYFFQDRIDLLTKIAGVVMIIMGLHMARILRIPLLDREFRLAHDPGQLGDPHNPSIPVGAIPVFAYARSLSVGAAYSLGWTPCVGPTLGAILTLAATSSEVAQGGLLLAVYALGFSLPFILAGVAIGTVQGVMRKIGPYLTKIEFASGVVIVIVGILVFSGALVDLNRYFGGFSPAVDV